MNAQMRSDRRKKPTLYEYRYLTYEECRQLTGHSYCLDRYGDIAQVKITSVKTWKTRPTVEVHWKYGMYEYGYETVYPSQEQTFFIELI